jgi:N6-adenosine-specific RNA methylase IME4
MSGNHLLADLPHRHFGAILLDPPWRFKSYSAIRSANPGSIRHVERHYATMSIDEIQALPLRDLAAPTGCHLFLWSTGPHLPQAIDTIRAWGFKYSGVAFTWAKLKKSHNPAQLRVLQSADGDFHVGLGLTTRKNCEFVLLARWGNCRRESKKVRELILAPRREHSRKPDETHERIQEYCNGPYLELFGRQERPGWTVRGDQVGKFR